VLTQLRDDKMESKNLVSTFKQQHTELLQMAVRLSAEGKTPTEDSDRLLVQFKRLLLRHLEQEDQHFYPKLFQAAKGSPRLMRAARVFAWDVAQITMIIKKMLSWPPDRQEEVVDAERVRRTLRRLRQDVLDLQEPEEIAKTVLAFFRENPILWLDPTDFEELLAVLRDRIDREETILFPIYEELTNGHPGP
jgi:hypothetical protein